MKTALILLSGIFGTLVALKSAAADDAPADDKPAITLINMHLKKTSPQDVFEELAKQGKVTFAPINDVWNQDGTQDDLDVDLTDRPFWSALYELCGTCNITPQVTGGYFYAPNFRGGAYGNGDTARQIMLGPTNRAQKFKAPVFEKDGFLVRAISFNRQQAVDYAFPEAATNNASVQVLVLVDPALHVSSFNQNIQATDAVDDLGQSMVLEAGGNSTAYGGGGQASLAYNCTVAVKYPEHAGKKIADLKFTVQLRGSSTVEKLSVDKPLDASEVSKDFGDTTVTFHSLKKGLRAGTYELKVGVLSDGDNNQPNLFAQMQNQLRTSQLLDSKGRAFRCFPQGGSGNNGSAEYTFTYSSNPNPVIGGGGAADASGAPAQWVLELPIKTHAIKLPVEFKDLPLP